MHELNQDEGRHEDREDRAAPGRERRPAGSRREREADQAEEEGRTRPRPAKSGPHGRPAPAPAGPVTGPGRRVPEARPRRPEPPAPVGLMPGLPAVRRGPSACTGRHGRAGPGLAAGRTMCEIGVPSRPDAPNRAHPRRDPPSAIMENTYFRKGFGLKDQVQPLIEAEYHSALVEEVRARGYTARYGDVTVRLAEEFGFCYGVDRAIDYAYETRRKFPDRRVYLVGEIIHNPHVNQRMREMDIRFIYPDRKGGFDFSGVRPSDVVLLPAFGVTLEAFNELRSIGCIVVDTTCGSVLLVWKRVESYARDGFTAVIHGKYSHEESRATASQVRRHPGAKYLIVRDMAEAEVVCDYITKRDGHLSRAAFVERFQVRCSDGFDPDADLARIGVANQTTMLASESFAIGHRIERAFREAFGAEYVAENYRSFGTICSATQERQDAVLKMMENPPDLMIVIGGYNSSKHEPPRSSLPVLHDNLPRPGLRVHRCGGGRDPAQARAGSRRPGTRGAGLAPGGPLRTRAHGRRIDAEQQDRRRASPRPPAPRHQRGGAGTPGPGRRLRLRRRPSYAPVKCGSGGRARPGRPPRWPPRASGAGASPSRLPRRSTRGGAPGRTPR